MHATAEGQGLVRPGSAWAWQASGRPILPLPCRCTTLNSRTAIARQVTRTLPARSPTRSPGVPAAPARHTSPIQGAARQGAVQPLAAVWVEERPARNAAEQPAAGSGARPATRRPGGDVVSCPDGAPSSWPCRRRRLPPLPAAAPTRPATHQAACCGPPTLPCRMCCGKRRATALTPPPAAPQQMQQPLAAAPRSPLVPPPRRQRPWRQRQRRLQPSQRPCVRWMRQRRRRRPRQRPPHGRRTRV